MTSSSHDLRRGIGNIKPPREWRPRKAPNPHAPPSPFPVKNPTTPSLVRAAELHRDWEKRFEVLESLKTAARLRHEELEEVRREYDREAAKAGWSGDLDGKDAALLAKAKGLEAELDPALWDPRLKAAVQAIEEAAARYHGYLDGHAQKIVGELESAGQKAHQAVQRIESEYQAKIGPATAARQNLRDVAGQVLSGTRPFDPSRDFEDGYPLPSAAARQRYGWTD